MINIKKYGMKFLCNYLFLHSVYFPNFFPSIKSIIVVSFTQSANYINTTKMPSSFPKQHMKHLKWELLLYF